MQPTEPLKRGKGDKNMKQHHTGLKKVLQNSKNRFIQISEGAHRRIIDGSRNAMGDGRVYIFTWEDGKQEIGFHTHKKKKKKKTPISRGQTIHKHTEERAGILCFVFFNICKLSSSG